jgi:peptidoglycan/LPS O-acetylase OafA/YrhL
MMIPLPEFDLMPKSVRVAMLLTFAGWCSFLFATYAYYDADSFFKFMVAGAIVCYYLYKGRRWARVMAMLSSVFIVIYGGLFTALFAGQNPTAMVVSAVNVVVFAASFYYLAIPETGRFFKKDPPADESHEADRNGPSNQDN